MPFTKKNTSWSDLIIFLKKSYSQLYYTTTTLQGRVVKPPPTEKSYHIFYQMMAGLNPEERSQLGLDGLSIKDLNYLNIGDTRQDELSDAQRFADWKFNLAVLGIPFMDVVRYI